MRSGKLGYWIMAVLSVLVGLVSLRFLGLGLANAFEGMDGHIMDRPWVFVAHVAASPVALILGVPQFSARLRAWRPGMHRAFGRIYVLAILIGGVAGFIMAMGSWDRPMAATGFGLLSILWLGTTLNALRMIRAGRRQEHRRWMIRSFALTFAAVTLRLQLAVFMAFGMTYLEASHYLAWLCWIPCVFAAEWILRRKQSAAEVLA